MSLSRRAVLGFAALSGAALPAASAVARSRSGRPVDWKALAASLDGSVELPGTGGYDEARKLVDPRFDAVGPPAVVRCAGGDDVAEAVTFARRSGLAVVTRCGGHSYVGASTSDRGLVLDLRRLAGVRHDAADGTATIGGGARLIDVYNLLGARGVSIPSGSCGTVGIGGVTLGGGIGMAASAYGMTCDVVVSADVVGADGRCRTVDAERHPELFWALRGGGGGQFGVVTAWRMRTHRTAPVGTFTLTYPWAVAAQVAAGWQARLSQAADETWSACQFASDERGALSVRISGVVLDGGADAEVAAIVRAIGREPATAKLDRLPYLDVVHNRAGCLDAQDCAERGTELVGSDVFRRVLPEPAVAALLATVERRAKAGRPGVAKFKRMTGAVARVAPEAAAFPWRSAQTMLQWLVMPSTNDTATVRDGYAWIDDGHRAMRQWSAGRYVNYLEPGPAALPCYYGPNLARLRGIRAAVDPHGLFRSPYAL